MKIVSYVIPVVLLVLVVGCSPSEKKQDVPPPPKASAAEASAPAPATPRQTESAKEIVDGYSKGLATSLDKGDYPRSIIRCPEASLQIRRLSAIQSKTPAPKSFFGRSAP